MLGYVTVEELRARRPRAVVLARALAIAAVVLWLPVLGYLGDGQFGAVAFFAYVFGMFGAVKGRQAGRVLATVGGGISGLFLLPYCWLGFTDDANSYGPAYAVLDLVAVAAACVSVGLLYSAEVNRYVHLVGLARTPPPR